MTRRTRKFFATLLAASIALTTATPALAGKRGGGIGSLGDRIVEVASLDGVPQARGLDLGWKHYAATFFWMPMYASSEGRYVLFRETDDGWQYFDLTTEEAHGFAREAGVSIAPPSIIDRFWGAMLILGLMAAGMANNYRNYGTLFDPRSRLSA